jgi:hypothetical protein
LESRFHEEINKRLENIQVKNVGRKERKRRISEKIKKGKNMTIVQEKNFKELCPGKSKCHEVTNVV